MSIFKKGIFFGVSVCDVTTGEFYATQITEDNNFERLLDEISRFTPAEIITNDLLYSSKEEMDKIKERFGLYVSKVEDQEFIEDEKEIFENYEVVTTSGKKIETCKDKLFIIASINGLLHYFNNTQKMKLEHINRIEIYSTNKYMALDINARRNLEITEKMRDKSKKGTLLWVLDKTNTSMGGRLLRRWLNDPLIDVEEIKSRLDSVDELKNSLMLRGEILDSLKRVYDIERLIGKISYGNANARDMISLKNSIKELPNVRQILGKTNSYLLQNLEQELDELKDVYALIDKAIIEEPPISVKEGGMIKKGYNSEVDELKTATTDGKQWLMQLEVKEKEETGIKNLKVGFNKVFGYYIEVTKSNLAQVPDRFIRKQTLTNGERYITEELKILEEKILGSQEKLVNLEYDLFTQIRIELGKQIKRIQKSAMIIATLDVLSSFATVAEDMNYVKPEIEHSGKIDIQAGRHPVIEKMLPSGSFVENDTYLNKEEDRLSIITGPNMAGKSTYMRQVALITLMAQVGSFVPANSAKIGVVDKIFTRVGASDDLSMGQSTFMVEMMEVATILKEATEDSLVILDEIGRGTSTYDGLSIAWAVANYIADKEKCGAKTLFATHYHELTELENQIDGIKNYSIAVKEKGEDIIFLRKIVPGGTDESYGIHVAKLAGVPAPVVKKANEILKSLERTNAIGRKEIKESKKQATGQLDMYNYKLAELAHEIDKINLNELTPIEALNTLVKLKESIS